MAYETILSSCFMLSTLQGLILESWDMCLQGFLRSAPGTAEASGPQAYGHGRSNIPCCDMPTEDKLLVLADVALGLHALHRQDVKHMDMKTANVLIRVRTDTYATDVSCLSVTFTFWSRGRLAILNAGAQASIRAVAS